jgi:hypothetical protein
MPYVLCKMVLAATPSLPITEAEYEGVKPAKEGLQEIISVEEKFDVAMENYVELEETLHNLGIRLLAFEPYHYTEMAAPLNLISRRILNLLSSGRLYRDALYQHVKRVLGEQHAESIRIKAALKPNQTQPMPYRMIEAVRNFAQHQELPIVDIEFDRHKELDEKGSTIAFAHQVIPMMDAAAVSKSRDIRDAAVRAALAALVNRVNPMNLIREHVEHIGTLHASFRLAVQDLEKEWERSLRELIARYLKNAPGENHIAVAAGYENADGTVSRAEYIVQDRLDYLKYLRIKHFSAANLSLRYVKW